MSNEIKFRVAGPFRNHDYEPWRVRIYARIMDAYWSDANDWDISGVDGVARVYDLYSGEPDGIGEDFTTCDVTLDPLKVWERAEAEQVRDAISEELTAWYERAKENEEGEHVTSA